MEWIDPSYLVSHISRLVSASAVQLVQRRPLYVGLLSSLWDGVYKTYFAANQKEYPMKL